MEIIQFIALLLAIVIVISVGGYIFNTIFPSYNFQVGMPLAYVLIVAVFLFLFLPIYWLARMF